MVCPSAAYELVIESITDCAFSCPISARPSVSGKGDSQALSKLTLIVLHDIAEVIAAAVMGLADAY